MKTLDIVIICEVKWNIPALNDIFALFIKLDIIHTPHSLYHKQLYNCHSYKRAQMGIHILL